MHAINSRFSKFGEIVEKKKAPRKIYIWRQFCTIRRF